MWHVSKAIFLRYRSRDNEYGTSVVTGLLKHTSAVKHKQKEQNFWKYAFTLLSFRSYLSSWLSQWGNTRFSRSGRNSSSSSRTSLSAVDSSSAKFAKEVILNNCNLLWLWAKQMNPVSNPNHVFMSHIITSSWQYKYTCIHKCIHTKSIWYCSMAMIAYM
jgi:hypothetical protein